MTTKMSKTDTNHEMGGRQAPEHADRLAGGAMNEAPIIRSDELASLIDQCKSDVRDGAGVRLEGLVSVMEAVAECGTSPQNHVLPQAVFLYSTELLKSHETSPSPTGPARERHAKLIRVASEQGIKALDIMRGQLCESTRVDYGRLMEAAGIFFQQARILSDGRRPVQPDDE